MPYFYHVFCPLHRAGSIAEKQFSFMTYCSYILHLFTTYTITDINAPHIASFIHIAVCFRHTQHIFSSQTAVSIITTALQSQRHRYIQWLYYLSHCLPSQCQPTALITHINNQRKHNSKYTQLTYDSLHSRTFPAITRIKSQLTIHTCIYYNESCIRPV